MYSLIFSYKISCFWEIRGTNGGTNTKTYPYTFASFTTFKLQQLSSSPPLHPQISHAYMCLMSRWYQHVPWYTASFWDSLWPKGMSAYMRCYLRHLYLVNSIVLLKDVLEILFPMECYHRHIILVKIQKPGITINDWLNLRLLSSVNNRPKCFLHFFWHWYFPNSTWLNRSPLILVVHLYTTLRIESNL